MTKNPEMKIELSSHTDARGNDAYNEDLSQRRAESAKRWLVSKGIREDRIVAKGYGEKVLLNKCANGVECTEEEHQENRRTEFKIIAGPTSIVTEKVEKERKNRQLRHRPAASNRWTPSASCRNSLNPSVAILLTRS
jgi:hypothetical protein